jgi:hypothetical protein
MNKRSVALLFSSLLLAGGAAAQDRPTAPVEPSGQNAGEPGSMQKGPSGVTRDGDPPPVNRGDAPDSPGAAGSSERLASPSGTSATGATGAGAGNNWLEGGISRQPGTGFKSSGSSGPAPGSGAPDAAAPGSGLGGGATGGAMR